MQMPEDVSFSYFTLLANSFSDIFAKSPFYLNWEFWLGLLTLIVLTATLRALIKSNGTTIGILGETKQMRGQEKDKEIWELQGYLGKVDEPEYQHTARILNLTMKNYGKTPLSQITHDIEIPGHPVNHSPTTFLALNPQQETKFNLSPPEAIVRLLDSAHDEVGTFRLRIEITYSNYLGTRFKYKLNYQIVTSFVEPRRKRRHYIIESEETVEVSE